MNPLLNIFSQTGELEEAFIQRLENMDIPKALVEIIKESADVWAGAHIIFKMGMEDFKKTIRELYMERNNPEYKKNWIIHVKSDLMKPQTLKAFEKEYNKYYNRTSIITLYKNLPKLQKEIERLFDDNTLYEEAFKKVKNKSKFKQEGIKQILGEQS